MLRNFNKAKLVAKRRKRENRKMFAKSRTYREIDAWQEHSLTIYKLMLQSNLKDSETKKKIC